MDHHLLPKKPMGSPIRVPYLCSGPKEDGAYCPYDEGPFLTYPERVGKPFMVAADPKFATVSKMRLQQRLGFQSVREQEQFVQAWCFFGLLCAFLRGVYRAGDFISVEATGTFVTTQKLLPKMLEAYRLRSANATAEERLAQFANAKRCLVLVHSVLRGCYEAFDWRVALSIASVSEIFARSLNMAMASTPDDLIGLGDVAQLYLTKEVNKNMLQRGWCPSEVHSISQRFRSIQTLVFLSQLEKEKPDQRKDHSHCNDFTCKCYQIDLNTYKTQHICSDKACSDVTANVDEIRRILATSDLPILEIRGFRTDHPLVKVLPSSPDRPFTALSHVWADGLGNPNENKLPSCQIAEIGCLVQELQRQESVVKAEAGTEDERKNRTHSVSPHDSVYVWIDTLCCPVRPESAKTISIKRMYETYSSTDKVLVLSKELRMVNFEEVGNSEALLRIFNSGWMARLWCLQEAYLPKAVWIQFQDRLVDLDALCRDQVLKCRADVREMCIYQDILAFYVAIRRLGNINVNPNRTLGTVLWNLDNALYHRSVSVAADEPLCLANLLNLSPDIFDRLPQTVESRMVQFWKSVGKKYEGLPQRLLLVNYPRLERPGFRWAPRTMLQADQESRILAWKDTELGRVSDEGFHVRYSGVRLRLRATTGNIETHKSILHTSLDIPCFFEAGGIPFVMWINDSITFGRNFYREIPKLSDLLEKDLAVIKTYLVDRDAGGNETYAALLGAITSQSEKGEPHVFLICPVILRQSKSMFGEMFAATKDISWRVNTERATTPLAAALKMVPGMPAKMPKSQSTSAPAARTEDDAQSFETIRPSTRVNTGMLSEVEFPPMPAIIQKHADQVFQEQPHLAEILRLLFFSQDVDIQRRTLAWMTWVTMRYHSEAKLTDEDQTWCIT